MNWRQKSSRYSAAVLFVAGITAGMLIFATVNSGFKIEFEIWLAIALVVSLILHARAGFAMSNAQREIELLRGLVQKIKPGLGRSKSLPELDFDTAGVKGIVGNQDTEMLERVKDAIENDRVDLYLQPIVSLPQRKQRHFEAFSRLRNGDGTILRPLDYLDAAVRANKIGVIDNMILLRAVQALRQLETNGQDYRIFCNISPATIFDQDFFTRFTDYLDANCDLAQRLVFEFTYPAVEIMNARVEKNLEAIARRGYMFSADHIRRFDLNWRALSEKNFRYVKASSALLLNENKGDDAARARVKVFKDRLREHNIDLIVEKVELEADMPGISALGIDFGQGDLFGAPRPASFYVMPSIELAEAS